MTKTERPAPTLELLPPQTVKYGPERVRTGGQMWRGLKRLLAVQAGAGGVRRVSVRAWAKAVWGTEKVNPKGSTLRGLIWRTNELLGGLKCPLTVSKRTDADGEWITLE